MKNRQHILAIDPQVKECGVACFYETTFTKLMKTEYLFQWAKHYSPMPLVIIEKPYIPQGKWHKGLDNLLITVGRLQQHFIEQGCKVELIPAWGVKGWIQQMFGRPNQPVNRQQAIEGIKQHVAAEFPEFVNVSQDEKAALCLGWHWLRQE